MMLGTISAKFSYGMMILFMTVCSIIAISGPLSVYSLNGTGKSSADLPVQQSSGVYHPAQLLSTPKGVLASEKVILGHGPGSVSVPSNKQPMTGFVQDSLSKDFVMIEQMATENNDQTRARNQVKDGRRERSLANTKSITITPSKTRKDLMSPLPKDIIIAEIKSDKTKISSPKFAKHVKTRSE